MFAIEMLPAQQGDALWIEYGDPARPKRILIDAGTSPTAKVVKQRIEALAPDDRTFELLIVTHIDTDHIGGVLKLLADGDLEVRFEDVWFNAWRHLPDTQEDQPLGAIDGEILDRLLSSGAGGKVAGWNAAFDGGPVMVPSSGTLPGRSLPGGMQLTLIAPGRVELAELKMDWRAVIDESQLTDAEVEAIVAAGAAHKGIDLPLGGRPDVEAEADTDFTSDRKAANGSSIVVLAEFEQRSALLTGDGFAPIIGAGVQRLLEERGAARLELSAMKLAHHGSQNNTSRELLALLDTKRFLVSSSGAIFGHPDVEAISRVLVTNGPDIELNFNYRVETTSVWDDPVLTDSPTSGYRPIYPAAAGLGRRVEL